MAELDSLIKLKFDLDYRYALQSVLRLWLFIHIPLTYGLILFTLVHIILVTAFSAH